MVLPGETIASGAPTKCPDCEKEVVLEVLRSGGGWYIGTWCNCGPYSRESGYYPTMMDAETALANGNYERTNQWWGTTTS